eukprot:8068013-Pyramimonas_sp.AAC.1
MACARAIIKHLGAVLDAQDRALDVPHQVEQGPEVGVDVVVLPPVGEYHGKRVLEGGQVLHHVELPLLELVPVAGHHHRVTIIALRVVRFRLVVGHRLRLLVRLACTPIPRNGSVTACRGGLLTVAAHGDIDAGLCYAMWEDSLSR